MRMVRLQVRTQMRTMTLAEMQWIWTRRHLPLRKLVHAGEKRRTRVGRNAEEWNMKVTVETIWTLPCSWVKRKRRRTKKRTKRRRRLSQLRGRTRRSSSKGCPTFGTVS